MIPEKRFGNFAYIRKISGSNIDFYLWLYYDKPYKMYKYAKFPKEV